MNTNPTPIAANKTMMNKDTCALCGSDAVHEVVEDSRGYGKIRIGCKHWVCTNCGSEFVSGSQMDHNSKCEVIEIEGPYKPIEISGFHSANVYFDWSWAGKGFGQLSFSMNRETGVITCNNECMSRDSVRLLLHAMADHLADTMELEDERRR